MSSDQEPTNTEQTPTEINNAEAAPEEPKPVKQQSDPIILEPISISRNAPWPEQPIRRTKSEPIHAVDALELANKFKHTFRTRKELLKAETDKRIKQLKQTQSDISLRLQQRGDEVKQRELRDALNANPKQSPSQTSVSNRTAQLLQQQKRLSQVVSVHRKQFVTQQVKSKEHLETGFNEEQLDAIDTMSKIFEMQIKQSLGLVVDDMEELQLRQEKCLQNISKSKLWFTKEERHTLNEMSTAMDKVPKYRKKLATMTQRVQEINWTVE
eukprot:404546_1